MKRLSLTLIAIFYSTVLLAQNNQGYELKTKMYESILNTLLNAESLKDFDNIMLQVDFERNPKIYSSDNKSYFVETIFPDDEKLITAYLNPSGKVVRLIFLHQPNIYSFIRSYLDENTIYRQGYGLWYSYNEKLYFSYDIEDVVAVLNVYDANYDW